MTDIYLPPFALFFQLSYKILHRVAFANATLTETYFLWCTDRGVLLS